MGSEAAKVEKETYHDTLGREAGLAVAARIFLVLGIVAILGSIGVTIARAEFFWLAIGAGCGVLGVVLFIVLHALSEIIMLLKRLSGLPYSGTISGTGTGTISVCSQCGSMNWSDSAACRKCGAGFEPGDTTGP